MICLEVGFWDANLKSGRIFWITPSWGRTQTGGGGGGRGGFYFQPISSCDMSSGRFFGMLISNLEEFFELHPPGGVHCGLGGEGGKEGDFFLSW